MPAWRDSPGQTVQLLHDGAHGFRSAQASASTRAWLASLEADAHAQLDDEGSALAALETAVNTITAAAGTTRPVVAFFDHARLTAERGVIAAQLGRADDARQLLMSALGQLDVDAVKIRSRLLTSLASALVDRGDPDRATQLATQSLEIATLTETERSITAIRELRRRLQPWHDTRGVDNSTNASAHITRVSDQGLQKY